MLEECEVIANEELREAQIEVGLCRTTREKKRKIFRQLQRAHYRSISMPEKSDISTHCALEPFEASLR